MAPLPPMSCARPSLPGWWNSQVSLLVVGDKVYKRFLSVSGFRDLVTGGAGGLLLLLPPGLQDNLEVDAKEHILALEEELLNAELDIPIYFAEETEELLELHATLTSEGEVRKSKVCP